MHEIRRYANIIDESVVNELGPAQGKHLVRNRWDYPDEVASWLSRNGFEELSTGDDEGTYSRVFASPNSKAIVKISKAQDDAWLRFADFAHKNYRRNPHVPKITRIVTYKGVGENIFTDGGELFIAFMERLQKIPKDVWYNDDFFIGMRCFCEFNLGALDHSLGPRIERDRDYFAALAHEWSTENKLLAETLVALKRIKAPRWAWDLHSLNFMLRGNIVVITDPFAS